MICVCLIYPIYCTALTSQQVVVCQGHCGAQEESEAVFQWFEETSSYQWPGTQLILYTESLTGGYSNVLTWNLLLQPSW